MAASRQCPDHDEVGWFEVIEEGSRDMPKSAGHPVALHGVAYRFPDDQTDPRSVGGPIGTQRVDDQIGLCGPHSMPDRDAVLRRPRHPVARRKHPARPASGHAVSERRPFARRLDTIARPARVRIRSRNPCTRARRRLLGWKVRLPLATAVSPHSRVADTNPPEPSR